MSYAVFKTGGKQYRAGTGEILTIEKIEGEAGAKVTFGEVLMVGEGDNVKLGGDLKDAKVIGEIVGQIKGEKLLAYRYKRRKGYHRTVGHRQKLTKVKVTEINAGRFFTTSNFFAAAGINMPDMLVRCALGEDVEPIGTAPLRAGLYWIRMVDMGYVLVPEEELDPWPHAGG